MRLPVIAFDETHRCVPLSSFFWQLLPGLASVLQPLAWYRSHTPSAPFRLPARARETSRRPQLSLKNLLCLLEFRQSRLGKGNAP